jgi:two-component system NtrC family response regulator
MKLLIVEDNDGLREQMKWALQPAYDVIEAATSAECLAAATREQAPLVCLDMGLDNVPDKGLEVIDALITLNRGIKIVVITAHTSETLGAEAIRRGAFDYLKKPVDIDHLTVILERAARLMAFEAPPAGGPAAAGMASSRREYMVGASEKMTVIFGMIEKLGTTDVNVLITGESGTGKEVCARAIHFNCRRREHPFVPINCGAIPETLLESELFGYVKGAFTGATADKTGVITSAGNGTLFLDEIGDMPKNLQVKLLRYIDTQTFKRLGDAAECRSNARIIAATNRRDLTGEKSGALRPDLYYRLSEFEIHLPSLRERGNDVLLLARAILDRNREKYAKPRLSLSPRAEKVMLQYGWPGNIRELENKLGRAAIMCAGQTIEPEDLQLSVASFGNLNLKAARDLFEKEYVVQALQKSNNVIAAAAQLLDVSRPTLYDLIKKHGILMKESA